MKFACESRFDVQKGYFLLELLISITILGIAIFGISALFIQSERIGMYSILQNRAVHLLRQEAEKTLNTPYAEVANKYTTNLLLFKPDPGASPYWSTEKAYTINIRRHVFIFPNLANQVEPAFKIVNLEGEWAFRNIHYTNVIQTICVP